MTLRGFLFLLVVGVAVSMASGLVVERFTAPGLERTLAFAAPVGLALYLAGRWGERRGWISGHAQLGRRRQTGASTEGAAPAVPTGIDRSTGEPK